MTPFNFEIYAKKNLLAELQQSYIKYQETYEWQNKQAMGTEGGESANHEKEVKALEIVIKDLAQEIKDLERELINNS